MNKNLYYQKICIFFTLDFLNYYASYTEVGPIHRQLQQWWPTCGTRRECARPCVTKFQKFNL